MCKEQEVIDKVAETLLGSYKDTLWVTTKSSNYWGDKFYISCHQGAPKVDASFLLHEIAHLIEIDDERACMVRGWGLLTPRSDADIPDGVPPDIAREIRVFAIQQVLSEPFGILPEESYSSLFSWLDGWWLLPRDDREEDYFRQAILDYKGTLIHTDLLAELDRKVQILRESLATVKP